MEFNAYQNAAMSTAIYPADRGLEYCTLGLASEAGEVAGKVKKIIRDRDGVLLPSDCDELAKECGDVLWYIATLLHELGFTMDGVAAANLTKLASRKERGVLGGSGDNR